MRAASRRRFQAIRQPRLAARLLLIVMSSLLCLVVVGGYSAFDRYDQLWNARINKLRSIAEEGVSIAAELERRVQAGEFTREQALQRFRDTLRPIRFDRGTGYYFVYRMDGETLVLGPTPNLEGSNRFAVTDSA